MDNNKTKNKKRIVLIATIALVVVAAVVGSVLVFGGTFGRQPAGQSTLENEIRQQLLAEGSAVVTLDETLQITDPLVVNGNKELTGSGSITFAPGARMAAGLHNVPPTTSASGECLDEHNYTAAAADLNLLEVQSGSLTLSGGIQLDGGHIGGGVLVAPGTSLEVSGGSAVLNGFYHNIAGAGEMRVSGGRIAGAGTQNVLVGPGGSLTLTGGSIEAGGHDGISLEPGAKLDAQGGTITQSGRHGIHNAGEATITAGNITANQSNIYNKGQMTLTGIQLDAAQGHGVVNTDGGTLHMADTDVLNSGAGGILNREGATLNVTNLLIRRTGARGLENAGGTVTGNGVTIYSCGAVALENKPGEGNLGGDVTIDGLTTSGASGMNVVQGSTGAMQLANSSIGLTSVTSIQVVTGSLSLDNVTIEGTTGTGAGVWALGGKVDIKNSLIKDTRGRGIAIAGGEVTGDTIEFSNIANVGIDNMLHPDGITAGTGTFTNLTFSGGLRDNVANTSGGTMTIADSTLGITAANNVRVTAGVLRLNNVNIQGTRASSDGENSYHGIYARGGAVHITSSRISNCVAGGIRNRGGNVYATGLTISNTKGNAVSNGTFSDGSYGNITLNNVTISGAKLGNILNECPGTFTGSNLVLNVCLGNSIHIKEGTMVLDNVEALGTDILEEGKAYHCVYAPGGSLTIRNSLLKNGTTTGIRNAGADILAENVHITSIPINDVTASAGTTVLRGCTLDPSTRTSVNITGAGAKLTLDSTRVLGAGNSDNNVNCVYVAPGAHLTVTGDTLITGSATRAGVLNEGGSFVMHSGSITGNAQRGVNNANKTEGGTTHVAVFDMYGGAIHGNGNNAVSGGGVYNGGQFTLHGGSIYNNSANTGGAINTAPDSLTTIAGGEIYGNRAVKTANNGNGGAIHGSGGAHLVLSGGKIYSNKADGKGDSVCHNAASFVMGADAWVSGDNDIFIVKNKTIELTGEGIGNPLADPVRLTMESASHGTIVVTTPSAATALAMKPYFKASDDSFKLVKFGKTLAIGEKDDDFEFVARVGDDYFITLDAAVLAIPAGGSGTIEVIRDITLTGPVDIPQDGNRTITLTDDGNGPHTITRGGSFTTGRMFILRKGNTLTLQGSSGSDTAPSLIIDGNNVGGAANDSQAIAVGASSANWDATLNLNAGVQFQNHRNKNGGTALIVNGTLHMTGGVMTGGATPDNGGAIYINTPGSMAMSGGSITGNTGKNGGGIYIASGARGTLALTGGTVSGNTGAEQNTDIHAVGALNMGGAPAVGSIFLPINQTIALTANITSATDITVVMADYTPGSTVLTGNASVISASYTQFKPGDATASINSAGKLAGVATYVAKIGTNKYTSLAAAFAAVEANSTATIELMASVTLTAPIDILQDGNRNITLTDDGNGPHTITRGDSFAGGRMFILRKGNTLTLQGSSGSDTAPSLIIDGNNIGGATNDSQAIAVGASSGNWDATLNLHAGVKFQNNLNKNGGTALIVNGTLNMTGGVMTGGTTPDNGGAIYINTPGSMTMSGGSITGNTGKNGGGIYIASGAKGILTLTGGTVSGNTGTEQNADIHAVGALNMGGAPAVGSISLPINKTIALTANITSAADITVVLADYTPGSTVLTGSAGVLTASHAKFVPANTAYDIDSAGKLAGVPVYVAKIGTNKYTSLAAAFGAVPSGGTATIEVIDNITLAASVDIATLAANRNITLTDDGNGPYTITRASTFTGGRMFILRKGNTLTLQGSSASDTAPSLIFDGNNVGGATNDSQAIAVGASSGNWDATLNLHAGVKFQNNLNKNGGTALIVNGTLNMTGGVMTGGTTPDNGGAIYINAPGTMTMSGGSITGNAGKNGGGIYIASGAKGILNLTGGTVSGNTGTEQNTDIHVAGKLNMGGAPAVGSVYLNADKTIALTANITSTANITVAMPAYTPGSTVLTGSAGVLTASHAKFVPANTAYDIDSTGKLAGVPVYVAKIGTTKYLTLAAAFAAVPANGTATIEVMDDITLAAAIDIPQDGNRTITLTDDGNGPHTITRGSTFTSGRMFILRKGNTLTLQGSSANDAAPSLIIDGNNVGGATNDSQAITVGTTSTNWDATLNLHAGVKFQNNLNKNGGTAVIAFGTFNMTGGVLTGGTTPDNGGAVYVHGAGSMTMSGGSITGNTGKNGGGIYIASGARGVLNLTGGTVSGNTGTAQNNDIHVTGVLNMGSAPTVGSVYLAAGKSITLAPSTAPAASISVVLPSYTAGTAVLTGDTDAIAASHASFIPADTTVQVGDTGLLVLATDSLAQPLAAPLLAPAFAPLADEEQEEEDETAPSADEKVTDDERDEPDDSEPDDPAPQESDPEETQPDNSEPGETPDETSDNSTAENNLTPESTTEGDPAPESTPPAADTPTSGAQDITLPPQEDPLKKKEPSQLQNPDEPNQPKNPESPTTPASSAPTESLPAQP